MEESFVISTSDQKQLYGVLHQPLKPTEAAVILVHGLTGHMDEYLHLVFARSFVKLGIAVIRFNQYDDEPGARKFHESTISSHVADTKSVIKYAKELGYNKLALVGHSLGAPVAIAAADSETSALLLWDPTATPSERIKEWETFDSTHAISYLDWRLRIILGKAWIEDAKAFPNTFEKISTLKIPIKIIGAELGGLLPFCERYRAAIGGAHQFVIIPKAGHLFVEEGTMEMLTDESSTWLLDKLQ